MQFLIEYYTPTWKNNWIDLNLEYRSLTVDADIPDPILHDKDSVELLQLINPFLIYASRFRSKPVTLSFTYASGEQEQYQYYHPLDTEFYNLPSTKGCYEYDLYLFGRDLWLDINRVTISVETDTEAPNHTASVTQGNDLTFKRCTISYKYYVDNLSYEQAVRLVSILQFVVRPIDKPHLNDEYWQSRGKYITVDYEPLQINIKAQDFQFHTLELSAKVDHYRTDWNYGNALTMSSASPSVALATKDTNDHLPLYDIKGDLTLYWVLSDAESYTFSIPCGISAPKQSLSLIDIACSPIPSDDGIYYPSHVEFKDGDLQAQAQYTFVSYNTPQGLFNQYIVQ